MDCFMLEIGENPKGRYSKMNRYCICKSPLVMANLETGKGECIICHKSKKLSKRLKLMSKIYKGKKSKKGDKK